ncbi:class I lanthipeptide [uncultured Aquimarina sp.]|uniref:class I lanthipeptide n=1 Tax=uncultured Aquimarina sp. TaxID=575652 RepID=UPI00345C2C12
MKKHSLTSKIKLDKIKIATLNWQNLHNIKGGDLYIHATLRCPQRSERSNCC